jgi:hypothetical protein
MNKLFFNSPLSFNDPFDCAHSIALEELSDELVCKFYAKSFKSDATEQLMSKLLNRSILREEYVELFKVFEKNSTVKRNDLPFEELVLGEAIRNDEVFNEQKDSNISAIKEIVNGIVQRTLDAIKNNMTENYGVCCFSEACDEMLMWSYYADGHTGFCLEFDTANEPFTKLKKVNYVKDIPKYDPNLLLNGHKGDDIVEKFLCTKFEGWKHEREWRILHKSKQTIYGYESNQLTGIYLGAKIDDTDKEIILTLLRSQNSYVKFYQMEQVDNSFVVQPKEITYFTYLEGQLIFLDTLKSVFKNSKFQLSDILVRNEFNWISKSIEIYLKNLESQKIIIKDNQFYSLIDG